jgi:protocadherin-15
LQLEIRAYDQGDPVLDSILQVIVIVKQVVTMPPESGMGFAELNHPNVQVLENSIPGTLIKTLEIGQKPDRDINIKCDIVEVVNGKGEKVRTPGL